MRLVGRIGCALVLWAAAAAAIAQVPTPSRVTCRVPGDPAAREYRLHREGDGWVLSFRNRETREQWIALPLPRAEPVISRTQARLSYRNANGGRQVHLETGPDASVLDVWVDHGLEVNIEPDLDPRVDLMNTDGRIDALRCVIAP